MSEFEKKIIMLFEMALTNQQKIISLLEGRQGPDMDDPANWLNTQQTLKILPVCVRTLFTLRKDPDLLWRKRGRFYQYFKPSLFIIRDKHIK
ncbi:MAG: hypothetical protein WBJ10_14660 [Daejeonella sp.]|uniref:hypothetical protein n=1 Tax=Daejeonella sp. TaxID=2805397 RepID=UPI003C78C5DE